LPTRLVVGQRVRATAEVYTAANDRRDADVVGWTSGAPAAVRVDGDGMITAVAPGRDRKSTRLNSSHLVISYAVFCLKKKSGSLFGAEFFFWLCSFQLIQNRLGKYSDTI